MCHHHCVRQCHRVTNSRGATITLQKSKSHFPIPVVHLQAPWLWARPVLAPFQISNLPKLSRLNCPIGPICIIIELPPLPSKMKVKVAQLCPTLYSPRNSPDQNTGVGSHFLLQGIFPTQGLDPGLLHCRRILYQLSYKWSPRILEWVAYPFSSRSSWPRNQTGVSCIAGGFFTNWAIREALSKCSAHSKYSRDY